MNKKIILTYISLIIIIAATLIINYPEQTGKEALAAPTPTTTITPAPTTTATTTKEVIEVTVTPTNTAEPAKPKNPKTVIDASNWTKIDETLKTENVTLLSGVYERSNNLTLPSNCWLTGIPGQTVITMIHGIAEPILLVNNSVNVKITGLILDHQTPRGCDSMDFGYGIQAVNTDGLEIGDCSIIHSTMFGLSIGITDAYNVGTVNKPCNNTYIHDNIIEDSPKDGIHIQGGFNHKIINNTIQNVNDDIIALGGNTETPIGNVEVVNNTLSDSNGNGVDIFALSGTVTTPYVISNIKIKGNYIHDVNSSAVTLYMDSASFWKVTNYTYGISFAANVIIENNTMTEILYPCFDNTVIKSNAYAENVTLAHNIMSSYRQVIQPYNLINPDVHDNYIIFEMKNGV